MRYRSTAYPGLQMQSIARTYPSGVSLVTEGRADLLYIQAQNRGAGDIRFWFGPVPNAVGGGNLPLDPITWTTAERTHAEGLIDDYGLSFSNREILELRVAPTGPVYSYNAGAPNNTHVLLGYPEDYEQPPGGWYDA